LPEVHGSLGSKLGSLCFMEYYELLRVLQASHCSNSEATSRSIDARMPTAKGAYLQGPKGSTLQARCYKHGAAASPTTQRLYQFLMRPAAEDEKL